MGFNNGEWLLMMTFKTTDKDIFIFTLTMAVREGLTFESTFENGTYIINYTGGY